jgi:hypothetical protein
MKEFWWKWTALWTIYVPVQVTLFFFLRAFLRPGISASIVSLVGYYSLVHLQKNWFSAEVTTKRSHQWIFWGVLFTFMCSILAGADFWTKGLFLLSFIWSIVAGLISGFIYGAVTGWVRMRRTKSSNPQ